MGHSEEQDDGVGPFTSRRSWRLASGAVAVWESRTARRQARLTVRGAEDTPDRVRRPDTGTLRRMRLLNSLAATAFTIGGALFALGAALAQTAARSTTVYASVYFVGGVFFTTGAYAALLQAINAPRHGVDAGNLVTVRWKWWRYQPMRIGWLTTFVLFTGTLVFGINLADSFLTGLTVQQTNRLIWTPDIIGCLLFLISGQLAVAEICHRWFCLRVRGLGWWIAAVNQVGSALFMVSALAAFTRPATGSLVNADVANWGTLTGAACFALGGVLQFIERP